MKGLAELMKAGGRQTEERVVWLGLSLGSEW